MAGTSQTVTVIITDLVGSTEMSSRLGPDDADAVRLTHFGLLRGAIASTGGREVKNLGDGLMVAYTSLSDALACAARMQQAVDRYNRRESGVPLQIRVGLAIGEAMEEDGDYFGGPVVEATRLSALADGGQILATQVVEILAGRNAPHRFVPMGELELKGFPDPVPSVAVAWEPDESTDVEGGQLPLPPRLESASAGRTFAFSGRTEELAAFAQAGRTTVRQRKLGVVLVAGEPGIGKTTLVAQAARAAHRSGLSVLYGTCEEGLDMPYRPWIEALSPLVDRLEAGELAEFLDINGMSLARALPAVARRSGRPLPDPGSDADAERFMIFEGFTRLLAQASAGNPLVVVLDDLHWADAASLQMLRHLVASALPMSVLVVGAFRESDTPRGHPLTGALADLRRESDVDRMELGGLGDVEILDLLAAAAGHELPAEGAALARALREDTAGNPFFVIEVVRHLAESGHLVQDDEGRWMLSVELESLELPKSVREVVVHRVARLGEDVSRVLSAASVVGQQVDAGVLARVTGMEQTRLLDIMEAAVAAGLLREVPGSVGRYRFIHALIRHTLYQDLSAARRQLSHLRVAEALEDRVGGASDRVTDLARQWLAAARAPDVAADHLLKALGYARRAGEQAVASYAPLDAIDWYAQALDVLSLHRDTEDPESCGLLVALGSAQRQAGETAYRETLLRAARLALRLGESELLVAAVLGGSRGMPNQAEAEDEWLELGRAALLAVGDAPLASRALLLAVMAERSDARDWARRRDLADEAIAIARAVDDEATLLDVVSRCYQYRIQPESLAERLAGTEEAVALADRQGNRVLRFRVRFNRVHACMEAAELGEVDRRLDEMQVLADETGLPYRQWELATCRCWRLIMSGDLGEAEATSDAALELGMRIGAPEATAAYGGFLYEMRRRQGRLDEIAELFVQAVADFPAVAVLRSVVVELHCATGRLDEARALFEPDVATRFAEFPRDVTWTSAMSSCADNAIDLGHRPAARILYDLLRPYPDRIAYSNASVHGSTARPLGRLAHLLGRHREAEALFESAALQHEQIKDPYWTARTKLDYADVLIDRLEAGDAPRARRLCCQASSVAQEHGFVPLQERAHGLLART